MKILKFPSTENMKSKELPEVRDLAKSVVHYTDVRQHYACPVNDDHKVYTPQVVKNANVQAGTFRVPCGFHYDAATDSAVQCPGEIHIHPVKRSGPFSLSRLVNKAAKFISDMLDGKEPPTVNPVPLPAINSGIEQWTWIQIDGNRVRIPMSLVKRGDWIYRDAVTDVVNQVREIELKKGTIEESGDWYVVNGDTILFQNQSVVRDNVIHAFMLEAGDVLVDGSVIETIEKQSGSYFWYRLSVDGDHTYALNGYPMHNADRYAVATGIWTDTAVWASSDGGSAGASVPTLSDNALLTATSGAITVTVSATSVCADFTCTGFTGTFVHNASFSVYGNFLTVAGMTFTASSGTTSLKATTTGKTITTGGLSLSSLNFDGVGGAWTLQDALTLASNRNFTVTNGSFTSNNQAITLASSGTFSVSGTAVRSAILGSSSVTVGTWTATTTTSLTFNAGTSTITVLATGTFAGGGLTYSTVIMSGSSTTTMVVTGANTFTVELRRTNSSEYVTTTFSATQTGGTLTITGNNTSTQRQLIASDTIGTSRSLSFTTVVLTNADARDINFANAAGAGTSVGDAGGNTNLTSDAPRTLYWVSAAGTGSWFATSTRWSLSSGGAVNEACPLPQDTAIFDASSFSGSGRTVQPGVVAARLCAMDWTGVLNGPTFAINVTTGLYGNTTFIGTGSMTVTGTATVNVRKRGTLTLVSTGQTITTSTFTVDSGSGVFTPSDAFVTGGAFVLTSGTVTCGVDITATTVSITGTSTRAWTQSAGTITLTSTGTVWDATVTTGLTLTFSGSTIKMTNNSSSTKTFVGGGLTYYNIWCSGGGTGAFDFTGANTYYNHRSDSSLSLRFESGITSTHQTRPLWDNATVGSMTAGVNHTHHFSGTGRFGITGITLSDSTASPVSTWYAVNGVDTP